MQNEQKKMLYAYMDTYKDELMEMSDYIFDNPEVGPNEFKAVEKICAWLEKEGFAIEKGIADIPTAFRAVYEKGTGGPAFGFLAEYDALLNPNMPSGAWHACGHHFQTPILLAAAKALKDKMDGNFKLIIYGTPSEETDGCKVPMIKAGCFQDMDMMIQVHGWDYTTIDENNLALVFYELTYHGKTAHAAAGPEQGRSALDACLLAIMGAEFLREHTREETRIHSTITNGGGPANVVPAKATAQFFLRHPSASYLETVIERFKKVVEGAAIMTGTEAELVEKMKLKNKVPSHILNKMVLDDCRELGLRDVRDPIFSRGSSDCADVQYLKPGYALRIPFVEKGISAHTEGFYKAGKTEESKKLYMDTAKVLVSNCYDIITTPGLMDEITKEHDELRALMG